MNNYVLLTCRRFYCCYQIGQKSRKVGTYSYTQYCKVKLVGSKQLAFFPSHEPEVVLLNLDENSKKAIPVAESHNLQNDVFEVMHGIAITRCWGGDI